MLILTLRTDKPEAEVGLFDDDQQLAHATWQAHRELAETIHHKIEDLLSANQKTLADLGGIVTYKGPGSFTGLRIGLTVANTFADSLRIPITGTTSQTWQQLGIERLQTGQNDHVVLPEYGSEPHITTPKH